MEESIEELEARLYAQVYHDTAEQPTIETSEYMPPNVNKQSTKRYWQQSKNLTTQKNFDQNSRSRNSDREEQQQPQQSQKFPILPKPHTATVTEENIEKSAEPAIKAYVPYTSVLSFMATPAEISKVSEPPATSYEKKSKAAKFPKNGKVLNPMSKQGVTKGKAAMKLEIQMKKQKAAVTRKKAQNKIVDTITLDDSDESDCIPVELPPPPLITLDSSDEETIRKKRAMSPSTSSIISDDFLVAGDKLRLVNPFKSEEPSAKKVAKQKAILEKVKALTKPSTSSSDSARSSCERNVASGSKVPTASEQRAKRRKSDSNENTNEDSIYGAKAKTKPSKDSAKQSDSSEDEAPCVNAKNQKPKRQKSTGSRKKSTDGDQSEVEDPKIFGSTPVAQSKRSKRSRFITPSYNEDEFASMISTILNPFEEMEDDESGGDEFASMISTILNPGEEVEDDESGGDENMAVNESPIEPLTIVTQTLIAATSEETDCEIVEQPIDTVEVPDDDDDRLASDSEDSMRGFNKPIKCDLSLNITQVPYDPHEYIQTAGETSQELQASTCDDRVNPEIGWNDEMKYFYDGSWGGENFNIATMLSEMPRDNKLWKISNADRYRTQDSGPRVRCRKCNEFGHMAARCNKPKKKIVCFMCGDEGHRETRCPNSICLRCAKPNRMFTNVCTSCNKLSKRQCPLCNYVGHDIDQCPDKWRRYHSTTSDIDVLDSEYEANPKKYCSICARRGHFAESCTQFFKTISGLITSSCVNIMSHKPSYPRTYLKTFDKKSIDKDNQQLLALITFFPFYRFNFQNSRCAQWYPKFLEVFRQHQERTKASQPAIEGSPKEKKSKRKKQRKSAEMPLRISTNSEGNRTVNATQTSATQPSTSYSQFTPGAVQMSQKSPQAAQSSSPTAGDSHDDSNSNYSFSDYYKDSTKLNKTKHKSEAQKIFFKSPEHVQESPFASAIRAVSEKTQEQTPIVVNPFASNTAQLADFIPLGIDENTPRKTAIEREPEQSCDARMLLTKEHFRMLTSEKGQNFIFDLQSRLNVITQFRWDSTGNSMVITGVPSNQSMFHLEIREYLYRIELDHHEKVMEVSSQLPKVKSRIVGFLKLNLNSVNKLKTFSVKKALDTMVQAEKTFDHKKALKARKTLNIAFIGDAELAGGGAHIGELRRIVYTLEKEITEGKLDVSPEMRDEITKHMKPIFSTVNHGDYRQLFQQYSKAMSKRKKQKLLYNPIN